jgi:hypothetical protein
MVARKHHATQGRIDIDARMGRHIGLNPPWLPLFCDFRDRKRMAPHRHRPARLGVGKGQHLVR